MPNYGKKQLLGVELEGTLNYLYESNVQPETIFADLGIDKYAPGATFPAGAFFEANSPKPARAKQRTPLGHNSSWCASEKIDDLKASDDWSVGTPSYQGIHPLAGNSKVVTGYITVGGVKLAKNYPKDFWNNILADLDGLGIKEATDADIKTLVWGATAPVGAIVQKINPTGIDGTDVYTTQCGETAEASLPNGWRIIKPHLLVAEYFNG